MEDRSGLQSLIHETEKLLYQINSAIREVEREADRIGCEPSKLRNTNGTFVLNDLLLAKSQALRSRCGFMQLEASLEEDKQ